MNHSHYDCGQRQDKLLDQLANIGNKIQQSDLWPRPLTDLDLAQIAVYEQEQKEIEKKLEK